MRVKADDLCPKCRSIIWHGTGVTIEQALQVAHAGGEPFDSMNDDQFNSAVYYELYQHHCTSCLRTMAMLYPGCCR